MWTSVSPGTMAWVYADDEYSLSLHGPPSTWRVIDTSSGITDDNFAASIARCLYRPPWRSHPWTGGSDGMCSMSTYGAMKAGSYTRPLFSST